MQLDPFYLAGLRALVHDYPIVVGWLSFLATVYVLSSLGVLR